MNRRLTKKWPLTYTSPESRPLFLQLLLKQRVHNKEPGALSTFRKHRFKTSGDTQKRPMRDS